MDLTLTTAILLVSIVFFYIYKTKKNGNSNIPGPAGYPIVGNTFDVDLTNIHVKLFQWSKIYGDIFQMKLFGQVFVVVSSSKIIRELFLKEPNATLTSARPDTFLLNYMTPDLDVAFTSYDKDWIKRRKLMHKLIHTYGEGLQRIERGITDKLSGLRQELSELDQQVCDPTDLIEDFVLSILQILLIGRYHERGSKLHKYILDVDEAGNKLASPGLDAIYNKFPFLRYLPLTPSKDYWRHYKLRINLLPVLEENADKDLSGVYQTMKSLVQKEESEECSGSWLTETLMTAFLQDFIAAAFLTTRGMLRSLIQILMALPHVQRKLQEEVDRVVGPDRYPSLEDRSQMPYSEAVMLETLRYISHVPTSLIHATSQDVILGEFTIPKGAAIIPNLWTMHHSENEWKDPFKFVPERFLDEAGDLLPADNDVRKQFMAFGVGKRSCVGEVFAKSRIFLFLTTLMQVCTVLPPDGETPAVLDPNNMVPGIVMHPHVYQCKFVNRQKVQ